MKKIAILGSTGSIGTQTLDIIRANPDAFELTALVAYSNAQKLNEQIDEFKPKYSALISHDGIECLINAVKTCDLVVVATVGICAIESVLYCLEHNIDVAIANKETLVCAGKLIVEKLKSSRSRLIPVDSEHFAISQCLFGRDKRDLKKILLTASGGPFWSKDKQSFAAVLPKEALKHPNWNMGAKITVDSATMMNKALEVIEARWLFDVLPQDIQIVVHRQSIVHSMVEFTDGSVIAQMAVPDMRIPIQWAILDGTGNYKTQSIDMENLLTLTFERCDYNKFPCANLGYEIFNYPDLCATVMNAANDVCVDRFLQNKLSFDNFYNIIIHTVKYFENEVRTLPFNVSNIFLYDKYSREYAKKLIDGEV